MSDTHENNWNGTFGDLNDGTFVSDTDQNKGNGTFVNEFVTSLITQIDINDNNTIGSGKPHHKTVLYIHTFFFNSNNDVS